MSCLHLLAHAPQLALWQSCLRLMGEQDRLVLLGEGVYGLLDPALGQALNRLAGQQRLYVLHDDLAARGLPSQHLPPYTAIDYAALVDLTLDYHRTQAWR